MLPWQHKNIRKLSAWMQLVAISSSFHLLLLSVLFFLYNYDTVVKSIHIIHKKSSDIPIFVVGYTAPAKKSTSSSTQKPSHAKKQSEPVKQKATSRAKPIQKELAQPKIATSAPIIEHQAATQIKKIKEETDNKKPAIKTPTVPEKVADKPKPKSAKQENIKPIKPKDTEPIVTNKPQEITKTTKSPDIVKQNSLDIPQDIAADAPVIVVNNYREKVALTKQYAFEKLVSHAWAAPVGAQGYSCTIKVYIGRHGSIQKMEMKKSSGIVMYDVQARNTLMQIDMPHDMWGNTIEITFES